MAVGDAAAQRAVFKGVAQTFFPCFDDHVPARAVEVAKIERVVEVFGRDFAVVDEAKNQSVHNGRFENLRHVERERKAAMARLVKHGDRRVERCAVDFAETQRVAQRVDEGNQGVDRVVGRAFDALLELGPRGAEDGLPRFVVGRADGAFDAHHARHVGRAGKQSAVRFDGLDPVAQVAAPARRVIVAQRFEDVEAGALDQLARQIDALFLVGVKQHLLDRREAGHNFLTRPERAGVKAVVIEEVERHAMLAQKIEKARVEIAFAEQVNRLDAVDGNRFFGERGTRRVRAVIEIERRQRVLVFQIFEQAPALGGGIFEIGARQFLGFVGEGAQIKRVLMALHPASRKDVVRAFHVGSDWSSSQ